MHSNLGEGALMRSYDKWMRASKRETTTPTSWLVKCNHFFSQCVTFKIFKSVLK